MNGISAEEHRERQARLRRAAAERGLQAVVAFSRGGGTHDRVGDVLWLAGLAAPQPFVPDLSGYWRGAGHVAVVVAVNAPATAIVEADELQSAPAVDRVVVSADVVRAAGETLAAARGGRIGVLGSDVLPAAWWTALAALVTAGGGSAELEAADDVGLELRRRKSPAEQRLLRAAGALGSRAMTAARAAAVPGASEAAVAAAFFDTVVAAGGAVYDVVVSSGPASGTLGPSGGAAGAARWTMRTLQAGEVLRIDAYGSVEGSLFDFARSIVVGGAATEAQAGLLDALGAASPRGSSGCVPARGSPRSPPRARPSSPRRRTHAGTACRRTP